MNISMDKKYTTRNGWPVRILCVDKHHPSYTVVGLITNNQGEETMVCWTPDGKYMLGYREHAYDLVEVTPYADFKIDEPVMARAFPGGLWFRRHFAGVTENGKPKTWDSGRTLFSSKGDFAVWDECRRPTEEELG